MTSSYPQTKWALMDPTSPYCILLRHIVNDEWEDFNMRTYDVVEVINPYPGYVTCKVFTLGTKTVKYQVQRYCDIIHLSQTDCDTLTAMYYNGVSGADLYAHARKCNGISTKDQTQLNNNNCNGPTLQDIMDKALNS